MTHVTPDVWAFFKLRKFVDKGAWPVGGGTLEQTQIFLDAMEFVWSEDESMRHRLGIKDEAE